MTQSVKSVISRSRKPMIDEEEVRELAQQYGAPMRRAYDIQADGSMFNYRWGKDSDRRAEVVFAIQGPGEQIWLHTKHSYPFKIFRLPSGGIEWDEKVLDALLREVEEETRLPVAIERFVALAEYRLHHNNSVAQFASYLFWLQNESGPPSSVNNEEVAEFRAILPSQFPQIAADLRNILGERRIWGHWRAIAHDIFHENL